MDSWVLTAILLVNLGQFILVTRILTRLDRR